jgi:hypothetical protein
VIRAVIELDLHAAGWIAGNDSSQESFSDACLDRFDAMRFTKT